MDPFASATTYVAILIVNVATIVVDSIVNVVAILMVLILSYTKPFSSHLRRWYECIFPILDMYGAAYVLTKCKPINSFDKQFD
ncbi:hypothetical protein J1N35_046211 [Gossypium stocksii]|uniref:Uncharacterized protein n=2 Tax=Gossypium stocksii TaxID=47602 RepID=A0A9D3U5B2_9ROSI|nr:hypothetical protein J1N35_046211 [Gossypium stocksii]